MFYLRFRALAMRTLLLLFAGFPAAHAGTLYVSLDGNNTIATYDTNASLPTPTTFVSTGPNSNPVGLAFDSSGNLYTANNNNSTIGRFTPGGVGSVFADGSSGLNFPVGLAIDAFNNVYAGTALDNKILKFTSGGAVSVFATGLHGPYGLAFDSSGNLFVENVTGSILKFTPGGASTVFASTMLSSPTALAFDSFGNLYATNFGNDTIVKFATDGTGTIFADTGGFHPYGLAIDSSNNLFVTNEVDTILKFTPNGMESVFATNDHAPSYLAFRPSAVPEPNSVVLGGIGAILALGFHRRKQSRRVWKLLINAAWKTSEKVSRPGHA